MNQTTTNIPSLYRDAMAKVAASVHVITTDGEAGRYGITLTAISSVTDTPPTVLLCINQRARIQPILRRNKHLCINVLSHTQQDVAEHFAGITPISAAERFLQNNWETHPQSAQPQLPGALAHLHGHIINSHDIGTHSIFYVAIDHIHVPDTHEQQALLYFQRQFMQTALLSKVPETVV